MVSIKKILLGIDLNPYPFLSQTDPNWWQARLAEDPCIDTAKLIPSRELEEKRKAFVPPEADYTTKIGLCGSLVSRSE